MRHIFKKIREYGWKWFIRRILREFIQPTTTTNKSIKLTGPIAYFLISKPINFIYHLYLKFTHKPEQVFYFTYDLEVEPITYNFCWALAIAEAKRQALQLTNMKIIIVPGSKAGLRQETTDYQRIVDDDARRWRIHNIILAATALLPSSHSLHYCTSRSEAATLLQHAKYIYPAKYNITLPTSHESRDTIGYGPELMSLQANPQALTYVANWLRENSKNKKVIVITLRQYGYTPGRNSNITEWSKFARSLDKTEFFVVIIPDTENASYKLPVSLQEFASFKPACWNIALRTALYELAYLNLAVNTGPISLCWLNARCRYISFKMSTENSPSSLASMLEHGFTPNESPPFTHSSQKWVWENDDYPIIKREFEKMYQHLEQSTTKTFDKAKSLAL